MCCIKQTHCSLIDHSTTANGLHEFKMMVVYSSSTKNVIVYWPLSWPLKLYEIEGGVGFNGGTLYLRWANLCMNNHFHCLQDATLKMPVWHISRLRVNLMPKEDCSPTVCVIGLTCALTCILTTVSATCWGGCTWQILQTVSEDRCYWSHVQITSNGATDDSCFHKCFSLGLSWLWVLRQTYHRTNVETVISRHFHMTRERRGFVTTIARTQALTWVLNAVSATCWGNCSDFWFPRFPSRNRAAIIDLFF